MRTSIAPAIILSIMLTSVVLAEPISPQEVKQLNQSFEKWWGTELVWRFDDLPGSAMVPRFRLPYAGAIYPDRQGGTAHVLRKYDRAFHGYRDLTASYEYRDIESTKESKRGGLFGIRTVNRTPHWAGHCNGWAAAAIRHAEPSRKVTQNGVVFTPSDIKGLLAELYVYTDIEELGGKNGAVHPAAFHVVLTNWIGRHQHPVAMDSTVGKEVWNYPIYAFQSSSAKRAGRRAEVKLNIGYVDYTEQEFDKGPELYKYMYFHYLLDLDHNGNIVGGSYHSDSNRIDMLWVPLKPTPGGQPGNEAGNPYLNVKTVLALWRASAPSELREKWCTIDPMPEDQVDLDTALAAAAAEKAAESAGTAENNTDTDEQAAEDAETTEQPVAAEPAAEPAAESITDDESGETYHVSDLEADAEPEQVAPVVAPDEVD